ncbi:MAG: cation diffusion facilitator family transporter [Nitrospirales bacterium]|nr:cation diffusion facilitator family transporter [Nitrospirales bacterium]
MAHVSLSHETLKFRLILGLILNAGIIIIEFLGGLWINSVGIMSDAGHNFIDQGALALTFYAHVVAVKPATEERTFGYHRAGIIAALINGSMLLVAAAILGYVALGRITSPVAVPGGWVILIAFVSFVANLTVALLFQESAKEDLNMRGAFWHMLMDAWVSLGVVGCGVVMLFVDMPVLDPLVSLIIVGVMIKGAWPLFRESLDILLESAPPGIQTRQVIAAIEQIDGVQNVHDFHIWALKPRLIMLTCHVITEQEGLHLTQKLLATIRAKMAEQFGINHLTIQLETGCAHQQTRHCDLNHSTADAPP